MSEQQQPKFRIQDNPSIIEIYANRFLGAVFDGSAVNLTFGSLRLHLEKTDQAPTQGQQPVVQITHRLTLSPAAAIDAIASDYERHGAAAHEIAAEYFDHAVVLPELLSACGV